MGKAHWLSMSFQIIDLPVALYLHIPFCPSHCPYCDFAVTVGTAELIEKYVGFVLREITFTPTATQSLQTVYLGGGTPSLLSAPQLERILGSIAKHFGLSAAAEITLECNPGTVQLGQLKDYRAAGINRISLGAQAFQLELLQTLGRRHRVAEIYQAVADIRRAGFANLSLDLMFGLPNQTLAHWQDSLKQALNLAPEHLSAYDLILEPATPYGRRYQTDLAPLPKEELTVTMYLDLIRHFTESGYEQYEIASLARPGYRSQHNQIYWQNQSYYGLGSGATGYVRGQRVTRPRPLAEYFAWVEAGIFTEVAPVTLAEELGETLMLGLRRVEGVALAPLREKFGATLVDQRLQNLRVVKAQGLVSESKDVLKLCYPQGFLLANEVLQEVI